MSSARMLTACLGLVLVLASNGCRTFDDIDFPWNKVELPPPPKENAVYRAGHWDQESPLQPGTLAGDFASARVLYDRGDHDSAERVFRKLRAKAEKEKNADMVEECLFMEAQSQFAQKEYPEARENYAKLLQNYPSTRYRNEAIQRQYEIADYWLQDTRAEMQAAKEGKQSWFSFPKVFHSGKDKPPIDEESNAVSTCQAVYTQDPTGPNASKALFLAGGANYFRENYAESDHYFSTLVDQHPKSPLAPKALELAIQSKTQVTGGSDYDGRKLTEARQMVDSALRAYPELNDKGKFLDRTLFTINEQQAEKDFKIAEFYERTGHPCSAIFYYEIVRRRYNGTDWAKKAAERMTDLRSKVETKG